ncbi:MAG: SLBB domain-containing protein [Bacteroidaceae bacterium]|nr:SLBB domain-containing protein [Bacteroidaceae bacterium]
MKRIYNIVFASLLMLCLPVVASAQSMSDKQVVEFVQKEQAKGTEQSAIVTKLVQRGVSREQLLRIRKKYESQKDQMGAINTSAQLQDLKDPKGKTRMRTNNLGMGQRSETIEDEELDFLMPDSVDMEAEALKKANEVYGRNIFNNKNLSFEPNANMATPSNYQLGAGDRVIIDVWGASQQSFDCIISPDGVVVIDGVGPLKLGGLTVQAATSVVKQKLGQFYSQCQFSLSVGETRSIQVQVMGEVQMPGTYTLSSLSSAFNALYAAGGISDVGTLRDIKVFRSGRQVATIDVYDYLQNGNAKGDIRLQDNDIVLVGPYDCLVNVRGKVKRPMWYEMKQGESVKQVLSLAGGFAGDAYIKNVCLTRKAGSEYSVHTVDEFKMADFVLMDGDSIYIDSVVPRFSNMVEVRGAVMHAGKFELGGDIQSVRSLLQAAEGLREDAFTTRAVMHRLKEDLTLEMISVDVEGILSGNVADLPLRKGDVLFIPSRVDMKGEQILKISGEVLYPGTYQYAENTTVEDIVLQAGGLTEAASMAKVDVFRRINDPNSTENNGQIAETFSFPLQEGFKINADGFKLQPYDEVVVRRSPSYSEQKNVTVTGQVNFEGQYSMTSKNFRLSDLVKIAGGVTGLAYTKGARLNRVMTADERLQRESSLRAAQIQLYEEALESDKTFDMKTADSLMQIKMDLGTTYPVAVNLEKAMANPGGDDDIVLREGDHLEVPQFSPTVKVSGEVGYPISMNYQSGQSLSYYIKGAGGYGNRAKKNGVYAIYMNGAVQKLSGSTSKKIEPGCEIVVPTKQKGNKMTTSEIMAVSSGGASLASVVVALISILKK